MSIQPQQDISRPKKRSYPGLAWRTSEFIEIEITYEKEGEGGVTGTWVTLGQLQPSMGDDSRKLHR